MAGSDHRRSAAPHPIPNAVKHARKTVKKRFLAVWRDFYAFSASWSAAVAAPHRAE
jgi:hypothetical protein